MNNTRFWVPPVIIAAVFCLAVVVLKQRQQAIQVKDAVGHFSASASAREIWKNGRFTDAKSAGGTRRLVEKIPIENKSLLPDSAQIDQLRSSITNLMDAYIYGDFDAYRRHRLPTREGDWNEKYIKFFRNYLHSDFPEWKANIDTISSEEVFKLYFHCSLIWKGVMENGNMVLDKGRYGTGFIQSIDLENSIFWIESTKTLLPRIDNFIVTFENMGVVQEDPTFLFKLTPGEVLKRDGQVTYATVKLLLKTTDDGAVPQFLRFFWSATDKAWLPIEFGYPLGTKKNSFAF